MEFFKDKVYDCRQSPSAMTVDSQTWIHPDFEVCYRQFPLWAVDSDFQKVGFVRELNRRQQKDYGQIFEGF